MTDKINVRFKDFDNNNGVVPMFGFAFENYCDKYKLTKEEAAGTSAVGIILENSDTYEEIDEFISEQTKLKENIIIFDISNIVSASIIEHVFQNKFFEEYEELPNVYEDRLVFVRKPI